MNLVPLSNFSSKKLCDLGMAIAELAKSESPNVCIYLSSADNACIEQSAYCLLPKPLMRELSIRLMSGEFVGDLVSLKVHMIHPIDVVERNGNKVFLTIEEFESNHNSTLPHILKINQNYVIYESSMLKKPKRLFEVDHPLSWATGICLLPGKDVYGRYRMTITEKTLATGNILVDVENPTVQHLIQKGSFTVSLDSLSIEQKKAVQKLIDLVGIKKVENLSLQLDEKWPHYSTEMNLIIEINEALFINNEGNPQEGVIIRAAKILHKKRPDIATEAWSKQDDFNNATKRITTAANSKNNK